MADTLAYNEIVILDRVPTPVHVDALPTADSSGQVFTNSSHHNVSSGVYPLGYKVSVYDSIEAGWSILTYLQYSASSTTCAAGHLCAKYTGDDFFKVSNDDDGGTNVDMNSYLAVALSAMTDGYYGFFWTGGVAPTSFCSDLAATSNVIQTDGNVTAADSLCLYGKASPAMIAVKPVASALNAMAVSLAVDA